LAGLQHVFDVTPKGRDCPDRPADGIPSSCEPVCFEVDALKFILKPRQVSKRGSPKRHRICLTLLR
jgi:hypothetical protein